MTPKVNLAIVGLGRAGEIHFKNIFQSTRVILKYAIDISQDRLDKFQNEYNDERTHYVLFNKFDDILNDVSLDAVIICTPTDTHEVITNQTLRKGKSVFCEKPISVSSSGVKACYDLAESQRLTLHCSMNRRYDPSLLHIHSAIRNGELGRVHVIKSCARDSPKPSVDYLKISKLFIGAAPDSDGIYHDCAIHDLDLMIWLLGKKPVTVYASSITEDPAIAALNDAETVVISLTFEDGTLGVMDLSRQSTYGYDQRVEVHGSMGMLQSLNQRPTNYKVSSSLGTLTCPLKPSFKDRYEASYVNSLNDFLDCVIEKRPSPISCEEVMNLARIADLCERSCQLKQVINCD